MRKFIGENEMNLTDERVAELVAKKMVGSNTSEEDLAVQIFLEAILLPETEEAYGMEQMRDYIKRFMQQHPTNQTL